MILVKKAAVSTFFGCFFQRNNALVQFLLIAFSFFFLNLSAQYATGMAAASQTIIIKTALSYQDVYEV